MKSNDTIEEINEALLMLSDDSSIPKNLRTKINQMISDVQQCSDYSILANRMLGDLEEMSSDINLQPFIRTQLWNIASLLERI